MTLPLLCGWKHSAIYSKSSYSPGFFWPWGQWSHWHTRHSGFWSSPLSSTGRSIWLFGLVTCNKPHCPLAPAHTKPITRTICLPGVLKCQKEPSPILKKMFATKLRSTLLTLNLDRKMNIQLNETWNMSNLGHNKGLCPPSNYSLWFCGYEKTLKGLSLKLAANIFFKESDSEKTAYKTSWASTLIGVSILTTKSNKQKNYFLCYEALSDAYGDPVRKC